VNAKVEKAASEPLSDGYYFGASLRMSEETKGTRIEEEKLAHG
jgi:hypothetical protein